jgi:hypothetical protein
MLYHVRLVALRSDRARMFRGPGWGRTKSGIGGGGGRCWLDRIRNLVVRGECEASGRGSISLVSRPHDRISIREWKALLQVTREKVDFLSGEPSAEQAELRLRPFQVADRHTRSGSTVRVIRTPVTILLPKTDWGATLVRWHRAGPS